MARAGVLAAAVSLFAGCGGGGAAAPTTTAPPTTLPSKNDVVTKANTYCQQVISARTNDLKDYQSQHPTPDPASARDFVVNTMSPLYDALIGAMHRLPQPRDDTITWLRLVDSMDNRVADYKQSIDQDVVGHVTVDPFADMQQRFTDFGLTTCATL